MKPQPPRRPLTIDDRLFIWIFVVPAALFVIVAFNR